MWDVWILALLLLISIVVPWRLAFYDESDVGWQVAWFIIDSFFFLDIILTFFTSVTDPKSFKEITDRKDIAVIYLKSWFIIDLLSVLPIDLFLHPPDERSPGKASSMLTV